MPQNLGQDNICDGQFFIWWFSLRFTCIAVSLSKEDYIMTSSHMQVALSCTGCTVLLIDAICAAYSHRRGSTFFLFLVFFCYCKKTIKAFEVIILPYSFFLCLFLFFCFFFFFFFGQAVGRRVGDRVQAAEYGLEWTSAAHGHQPLLYDHLHRELLQGLVEINP